jgi:stage II sporulation protein AA (anti-sigma F factor antagonist)
MSDLQCLVGSAVVVLPDEIDIVNAGSVREQLAAAIVPGVAVVVADLSMTTFCDCAGVRSLLLAHREASASNAELRLVARSRAVLRILELLGTDQVLPVYPDLTAALAGSSICTGAEGAAPPSTWRTHDRRAPEMPPNRRQQPAIATSSNL